MSITSHKELTLIIIIYPPLQDFEQRDFETGMVSLLFREVCVLSFSGFDQLPLAFFPGPVKVLCVCVVGVRVSSSLRSDGYTPTRVQRQVPSAQNLSHRLPSPK